MWFSASLGVFMFQSWRKDMNHSASKKYLKDGLRHIVSWTERVLIMADTKLIQRRLDAHHQLRAPAKKSLLGISGNVLTRAQCVWKHSYQKHITHTSPQMLWLTHAIQTMSRLD